MTTPSASTAISSSGAVIMLTSTRLGCNHAPVGRRLLDLQLGDGAQRRGYSSACLSDGLCSSKDEYETWVRPDAQRTAERTRNRSVRQSGASPVRAALDEALQFHSTAGAACP